MDEFEVTCKVIKGERNIAYGEDCYCYYTQANYNERIVRCRDCKYFVNPSDYDLKPYCDSPHEGYAIPPNTSKRVKPDGFCSWGEPREVVE